MLYYQNISLLPNSDINLNFILSTFYRELHLSLVEQKTEDNRSLVGINFPDSKIEEDKYKQQKLSLGNKLKIFSMQQGILEKLNLANRLQSKQLADYLHFTKNVRTTEDTTIQHCVKLDYKGVADMRRLVKRFAKRNNLSYEIAKQQYTSQSSGDRTTNSKPDQSKTPFVWMYSSSTDNNFPLYINIKGNIKLTETAKFNLYGLAI